MPKDDLELEDKTRSFRCENAIGRVLDKYITAWERRESDVIRRILRYALRDELPPALRPKDYSSEEKKKQP
jgi:hypothetical protein